MSANAMAPKGETIYRYERKYKVHSEDRHTLLSMLKYHSWQFMELYPPRAINNIYYDTPSLSFYKDNIEGISNKVKIRLRWYGEGRLDKSIVDGVALEIKKKLGHIVSKEVFHINGTIASNKLRRKELGKIVTLLPKTTLNKYKAIIEAMRPVVENSYYRRYYFSKITGVRMTFDSDIEYRVTNQRWSVYKPVHDILELKYPVEDNVNVIGFADNLPIRLSTYSKYADAIAAYPYFLIHL